jgi:hypothetical protein
MNSLSPALCVHCLTDIKIYIYIYTYVYICIYIYYIYIDISECMYTSTCMKRQQQTVNLTLQRFGTYSYIHTYNQVDCHPVSLTGSSDSFAIYDSPSGSLVLNALDFHVNISLCELSVYVSLSLSVLL